MNPKDWSVSQTLMHAAKIYGEKEALFDLKRRMTYQELDTESGRLAAGLKELGVARGDRIGICLPNWNETVVLFFAAAKIGATLVPFNPMYRSHEIEYILENSKPHVLFISRAFEKQVSLSQAASLVHHVIAVRFKHKGMLSYSEIIDRNEKEMVREPIDVDEDVFCILYTSGTTGMPKGVMTVHRSVVQCAFTVSEEMHCNENDVFIVPAPLFHIFGITCNVMTAIASGARMILLEKYHPKTVLQLIEKEQVTVHQGVPTMFLKELDQEDFINYDLSTLRTGMVGAAPISPEQVQKIRKEMNFELCQSFGITETGSVTITRHDDDEKTITETVGRPLPGITVNIVDENRKPLPPGEVGEIAVYSFGNMKGYYQMPEKTREVLDDEGWFYTGDLGILDEKGNVRFVGRQKELIIRGGLNIYPQEIEAVLLKHPEISEAAVIGLPDDVLGERACAVIQLKPERSCTEDDIKQYVAERIATYKVPENILFSSEFPVTASGKIQKGKLKEQVLEHINA